MSESCLPAELFPGNDAIEYSLPQASGVSPAFLFVVDTVLGQEDLEASLLAVKQALELLPQYAQVGLITYGEMVRGASYAIAFATRKPR